MKKLNTHLCRTLVVLLGSAGSVFAEGKWLATKNYPNVLSGNPNKTPEKQQHGFGQLKCV